MKKIKFFGFKFIFKLEKENKDDVEIYSQSYNLREKVIYILLIMGILSFSTKLHLFFNQNNYKKGSIVKEDIYAPQSVKYRDLDKRQAIIEELILTSKKEYIHVPEVAKSHYDAMENLYNQVIELKKGAKIDFNYKIIEEAIEKDINKNMIKELSTLSLKQLRQKRDEGLKLLQKIYKDGIVKEDGMITIKDEDIEKIESLSPLEEQVIRTFLVPNYIFDKEKTKEEIEKKTSKIGDQIVEIPAGTVLAKKGEVLTDRKLRLLSAAGIYSYSGKIARMCMNVAYFLIIGFVSYQVLYNGFKKEILKKNVYKANFLLLAASFLIFRFLNPDYIFILPFEVIFFMLGILINTRFAVTMSLIALSFLIPIANFNLIYFTMYTFAIVLGGILLKDIKTRSQLINLGVQLSIIKFLIFLILSYFISPTSLSVLIKAGQIIVAGVTSGMISIALLPYFERTFNVLTKFKLLELGDLSHPLLKQLSVKTPGTFYHSMMVATISEAAAEAIGADSIFTRVACYYHDIGKMKRPKFYVENQEGGVNPHNKISPFLSALIISAHTKEGAELGKEYQIPKEIRDIMFEHQGTTLLAYFYNKAKKENENILEEDFRYSGPKPKTKESAIIMLADSIEAAVRSLDEKTPITIETMIRKIISGKMADGQLSDADLTFKEIEKIIKVFTKTLMGIHHVRIKYPDQKK